MPIFEFECGKCGKECELLVGVGASGRDKPACPHCGSKKLKKLLSAPMIGIKGGPEPAGGGGGGHSSCGSCSASSCSGCGH